MSRMWVRRLLYVTLWCFYFLFAAVCSSCAIVSEASPENKSAPMSLYLHICDGYTHPSIKKEKLFVLFSFHFFFGSSLHIHSHSFYGWMHHSSQELFAKKICMGKVFESIMWLTTWKNEVTSRTSIGASARKMGKEKVFRYFLRLNFWRAFCHSIFDDCFQQI